MKKIILTVVFMMLLGSASGISSLFSRPEFGKLPAGQRLERIKASPNYADGAFRNQLATTLFSDGAGHFSVLWEFMFGGHRRVKPAGALPVVKTNLKALNRDQDVVIWLGHSSYFMQLGGHRILIDPIFSAYAAPFSFLNRAFKGDYPYSAADMPGIDYLIISHDHWDHLDYPTLAALKPKITAILCPLGVGAHLEYWGFAPDIIHESDWGQKWTFSPGLTVHVLPARHFSGRGLTSNKTLWASFMLETPLRRIFYSGDSGYGPHFARIGDMFGEVDLAIMENGQYDKSWKYIHMLPEQVAQAATELGAKSLLPAHSGRFSMSNHAWDDPYRRLAAASADKPYKLLTPEIGEVVVVGNAGQIFNAWWENKGL
ncbi:MBL fold metallo-hydrolase [Acerihabitans arboris]|uniref:MBL fold metallo-hydrolase n=1 Tax=Acerihabitans arboris TaxID=2691583 RepID=A0A845SQT0_9GAMM|nr:MBL fold metallo-hydrolase [Acerihabitans arboris]NDL64931.1 MBL fold metallo-hydrolase [Acerihabitans arboris]